MRTLWGLPAVLLVLLARGFAQDTQTAYCDYADGNQVSMQYSVSAKEMPRNGRVWSPGITLFVQVPLTLAGEIPDPTKQLQLSFAHMSAKQCSLRVYYAKVGAFTDFLEK